MKTNWLLLALTLGSLLPGRAAVYDWDSGFANNGLIPGDGASWSDTRSLSGLDGTIGSLEVRLHLTENPAERNNGDLYAYLTHGDTIVVLLNRVGRTAATPDGYLDAGFNITLSALATTDIHLYGGNSGNPLSGVYQPDGRDLDPTSSGAAFDSASRQNGGSPLGRFTGLDPNGDWTLHFSDHGAVGQSTVASWGFTLTVVPEPMTTGLLAAAVCGIAVGLRRQRRRKTER